MAETIGYLKAVHVLVAVPEFLAELLESNQFPLLFHDLRAFAIDEVDACFEVDARHIPFLDLTTKARVFIASPKGLRRCIKNRALLWPKESTNYRFLDGHEQ